MLNPVHLRTLNAVLRLGSFADAARDLGYTGSAVSQQMSALERRVGLTLFEREAHSIRATPAAEEIAARSAAALGALQGLEDDIGRIASGTVGRLRVGSFPTAGERLLPSALSTLRRQRPDLDVHLDEDEPAGLVALLERREVDVALLYRYRHGSPRWPASLGLRSLLVEDLLLLRPSTDPGGSTEGEVRLGDLREATWISPREDTWGAATLRRLCRASGFDPMVGYRSNDYDLVRGLVASGLGVALVPALAYKPDPAVRADRLDGVPASREVLVASVPTAPAPLVDGFDAAVRAAARRLGEDAPGLLLAG